MAIVGRSIPNVPIVERGSLADDPVLTTRSPIVVAPPTRQRVATVLLLRGSLEDIAVPAVATPQALVAAGRRPRYAGTVLTVRGTLQDDVPATTPGPLVAAAPTRPRGGLAVLRRGSLEDAATPQPLVIVAHPRRSTSPTIVLRPLVGETIPATATPQPIVVDAGGARIAGRVMMLRAPAELAEHICVVDRPFTGTVSYLPGGAAARPDTGTVSIAPGAAITRPDTGTVINEC